MNAQTLWTSERGRDLFGFPSFAMGRSESSLAIVGPVQSARMNIVPFVQYSSHCGGILPTTESVKPLCLAFPGMLAADL